jgi:adenine-specific DNA-methyltransferase
VFVQISDENVHRVMSLLDEIFGNENFCSIISARKTSGANSPLARVNVIGSTVDYILWYAKDRTRLKYRQLYRDKAVEDDTRSQYQMVELPDGTRRRLTRAENRDSTLLPAGSRIFRLDNLTSGGWSDELSKPFTFQGRDFRLAGNLHWKTTAPGMMRLAELGRITAVGNSLAYVRFADDFPVSPMQNLWNDTGTGGFGDEKSYVVQTVAKLIQRCVLMTSDPGDLVLDPTCGSGTTAYVAEMWGRRWITIDVSRVPLALARQRLLTSTFPYFRIVDSSRGVGGGFEYQPQASSLNRKGDGFGVVPHVTLKSVANDAAAEPEVLVDRPERDYAITRVSGPFVVEATVPTPLDLLAAAGGDGLAPVPDGTAAAADFLSRMLETLRRAPRIALGGNEYATLTDIRQPARSLSLAAEARLDDRPVAIAFGPENGAVNERLVAEAAREAYQKGFTRLFVFGFAIEPNARLFVDRCEEVSGIPATYVAVTPDVAMGDLLKNQRSSQVFSVAGLPDICLLKDTDRRYRVELRGLDTFDPATMEARGLHGDDVPAWFLDTNYDEYGAFTVDQAFFPRTGAWDALRKDLRGAFEDSVWDALSGTLSEPFEPGDKARIAVKVIDERGNELIAVKTLDEAE